MNVNKKSREKARFADRKSVAVAPPARQPPSDMYPRFRELWLPKQKAAGIIVPAAQYKFCCVSGTMIPETKSSCRTGVPDSCREEWQVSERPALLPAEIIVPAAQYKFMGEFTSPLFIDFRNHTPGRLPAAFPTGLRYPVCDRAHSSSTLQRSSGRRRSRYWRTGSNWIP
jgi:hypothetical protein